MSRLEAALAQHIRATRLPGPMREYRFSTQRRWRFDFAWPDYLLAVEVEGGGWSGGRHTRPKGFAQDLQKYSEALAGGWTVYRCDKALIDSGRAIEVIAKLLRERGADVAEY